MITYHDLRTTAKEYLRAAKILRARNSYSAAVYLCGYSIEIALKARICRTLRWTAGFPETQGEFKGKNGLKIHDFEGLLNFTAIQEKVKGGYIVDWSIVNTWKPEMRYSLPEMTTPTQANDMIQATQTLLRILL